MAGSIQRAVKLDERKGYLDPNSCPVVQSAKQQMMEGSGRARMLAAMQAEANERLQRRRVTEGSAGGFFDRQDTQDRNAWDSDDELVDEFGRRKKRKVGSAGLAPSKAKDPESKPVLSSAGSEDGLGCPTPSSPSNPVSGVRVSSGLEALKGQRLEGIVKWYEASKGFGFLKTSGILVDIYFKDQDRALSPVEGTRVSFDLIVTSDGKPQARNITRGALSACAPTSQKGSYAQGPAFSKVAHAHEAALPGALAMQSLGGGPCEPNEKIGQSLASTAMLAGEPPPASLCASMPSTALSAGQPLVPPPVKTTGVESTTTVHPGTTFCELPPSVLPDTPSAKKPEMLRSISVTPDMTALGNGQSLDIGTQSQLPTLSPGACVSNPVDGAWAMQVHAQAQAQARMMQWQMRQWEMMMMMMAGNGAACFPAAPSQNNAESAFAGTGHGSAAEAPPLVEEAEEPSQSAPTPDAQGLLSKGLHVGHVKSYNASKGFGFIQSSVVDGDIYFKGSFPEIRGRQVSFRLSRRGGRSQANTIEVID